MTNDSSSAVTFFADLLVSTSVTTQLPEVEPVELSLCTDGLWVSASVTVQTPLEEFLRSMVVVLEILV